MNLVPPAVRAWYGTPHGKRMFRYTMVSVVAVPVGLAFDVLALDLFGWSPAWSGIFGAAFGAIPSYYLNRSWAWGKTGKSHVWKEIVPFWVIAFISTLFAGWTQNLAGNYVGHPARIALKRTGGAIRRVLVPSSGHAIVGLERQVIILGAYLTGFAILWVVKYVIYNKVLFVVQHHHDGDLVEPLVSPMAVGVVPPDELDEELR